jgi:hypothetical protein
MVLILILGWCSRHIDVDCAYLYGKLEEDIYMRQPPGFFVTENPDCVLKLNKAIYGLKQAGRNWNLELDKTLIDLGFVRSKFSNCLYMFRNVAFILVYVDDMAIFGKTEAIINQIKNSISSKFDIKDLGEVKNFLGVQFEYNSNGKIFMHQSKYIKQILTEFDFLECRNVSVPIDPGTVLCKNQDVNYDCLRFVNDEVPYRRIIGILNFIADRTRPDLMFAVRKLSQYCEKPGMLHWVTIKHILRYLSGSRDKGILLSPKGANVVGYSDADWAGDTDDRRSFSGHVVYFGDAPISWRSGKQNCVALSSAESEYISLNEAVRETIWLSDIINELNVFDHDICTPMVYCDNRSAVSLAINRIEKRSSKHIDIKYHYIRDKCEERKVTLHYISSGDNVADIFTKSLKKPNHHKHCENLCIV